MSIETLKAAVRLGSDHDHYCQRFSYLVGAHLRILQTVLLFHQLNASVVCLAFTGAVARHRSQRTHAMPF